MNQDELDEMARKFGYAQGMANALLDQLGNYHVEAVAHLGNIVKDLLAERDGWKRVAERFYNLHVEDREGWEFAILDYEGMEKYYANA
jgi:hypothetical protein